MNFFEFFFPLSVLHIATGTFCLKAPQRAEDPNSEVLRACREAAPSPAACASQHSIDKCRNTRLEEARRNKGEPSNRDRQDRGKKCISLSKCDVFTFTLLS